MYKLFLRPLFFLLPAETAHRLSLRLFAALAAVPGLRMLAPRFRPDRYPSLARRVFGLDFPNPVGLAAGFDKDARDVDLLERLGFGFIEIGTLTPRPQAGNLRPRLFRLPADRGLINRMGFNNGGVEAAVERLRRRKGHVLVGGNIGKNKDTPNEHALDDYAASFEALFPVVDYFVVNVSSPNTPGLRELQDREPLTRLLLHLQQLNDARPARKPLLLKIAPDLSDAQLDDIVALAADTRLDGLICTNTTISREGLRTPEARVQALGAGGLSGAPVRERSNEVIRYVRGKAGPTLPIIGVGGIFDGEDAASKLEAGADLVQVYTGFIYEGPAMVERINRYLAGRHMPQAQKPKA